MIRVASDGMPIWRLVRSREEFGRPDLPLLTVISQVGVRERDLAEGRAPSEDLSGYRVVRPGDLVVNKLWARFGAYGVSEFEGIISPAYWVLQVDDSLIEPRYLHYVLQAAPYRSEIARRSKNMPPNGFDLPWAQFRTISVPLPSRDFQLAQVQSLDVQLARISTLRERAMSTQTVLDEAERRLADDVLIEAPRLRLGWLADVRTGLTLGKKYGDQDLQPTPYLRVANVQAGSLDLGEVKEILIPETEAQAYVLSPGDVLMTEGGDIDKLGRGTVWHGEIAGCVHQNHVFAVRVQANRLLPAYLALVTRSSEARSYFERTASRSTNLASTSSSKVRSFRFPVPCVEDQQRIVTEYEAGSSRIAAARKRLTSLVDLLAEYRDALIMEAVHGVVDQRQDGSDETTPALMGSAS